jgi:DNA mismatch endonuclease, patch repair protein
VAKLNRNRRRDRASRRKLRALGWGVLTVWECQVKDPRRVAERVRGFLGARE